ncbi:hypothetical protein M9Y10_038502 [Tritrichomonas musculus]|uniref:Ubiquitin-like domain-containing protein n=1 Tax=Tritrichomonas musculus TaxID=1915356 RepID=A0ABR2K965_9EUKA
MQITCECGDGKNISFYVQPTDTIGEIKSKIQQINNIPKDIQRLIYNKNILEDRNTVQFYGIQNGSILQLNIVFMCGNCPTEKPSKVIGLLNDDHEKVKEPLKPGKLTRQIIRNTNSSCVYEQIGGTCYAYAATSAYINTVMRIYGAKEAPSFGECFAIANYNGSDGGYSKISLEKLENHFHYGICADKVNRTTIYNVLKISVVVSFSTSKQGWINVGKGELLTKPDGPADGRHAAVVEGYDFDKRCLICKNSWGDKTAKPRFYLKVSATHDHYFVHTYFTLNSIAGLTKMNYVPRISRCITNLNGFLINSAWMDQNTAIYESDFISEKHNDKSGPLNFLGYDLQEWIYIQLNPNVFPLCHMKNPISYALSLNDDFNLLN